MTIRNLITAGTGMASALDRVGFPHVCECGSGNTFASKVWLGRLRAGQLQMQHDTGGSKAFAAGDAIE